MILVVQGCDNGETTDTIMERFKSISLIDCQHAY